MAGAARGGAPLPWANWLSGGGAGAAAATGRFCLSSDGSREPLLRRSGCRRENFSRCDGACRRVACVASLPPPPHRGLPAAQCAWVRGAREWLCSGASPWSCGDDMFSLKDNPEGAWMAGTSRVPCNVSPGGPEPPRDASSSSTALHDGHDDDDDGSINSKLSFHSLSALSWMGGHRNSGGHKHTRSAYNNGGKTPILTA